MPPVKHVFCPVRETLHLSQFPPDGSPLDCHCRQGGAHSSRFDAISTAAPSPRIINRSDRHDAFHHLWRRDSSSAVPIGVTIGVVVVVLSFVVLLYFACWSDECSKDRSKKKRSKRCRGCGHRHMSQAEWRNCHREWRHRQRDLGADPAVHRAWPSGLGHFHVHHRHGGGHHRGHRGAGVRTHCYGRHHGRHRDDADDRKGHHHHRRRRRDREILELQNLANLAGLVPQAVPGQQQQQQQQQAQPDGGVRIPNDMDAPQDDPVVAPAAAQPQQQAARGGAGLAGVLNAMVGERELRRIQRERRGHHHHHHRRHHGH